MISGRLSAFWPKPAKLTALRRNKTEHFENVQRPKTAFGMFGNTRSFKRVLAKTRLLLICQPTLSGSS